MKLEFVANGFERWSNARAVKTRANIRTTAAAAKQSPSFFGEIRLWFQVEMKYLRRQNAGEKTSPKILW